LRQVLVLDTVNFELRTLKHSQGEAQFASPYGLAVDDVGRIYVGDAIARTISVFGPDEKFLFAITHPDLERPTGLAVDAENELLYVADTPLHKIAVFDLSGDLIRFMGGRGNTAGYFNFPTDVDVDTDGNLYVMDSMNARVEVFDVDGRHLRSFGERGTADGSFAIAKNLALSTDGHVYVTDAIEHKLVIFSREGDLLLRIGARAPARSGVSPGGFNLPRGVDVDRNGTVWVVDTLNRIVHRFQYLTDQYLQEHPIEGRN
jgi:DNA-binding beta-propeller fold protein YncE